MDIKQRRKRVTPKKKTGSSPSSNGKSTRSKPFNPGNDYRPVRKGRLLQKHPRELMESGQLTETDLFIYKHYDEKAPRSGDTFKTRFLGSFQIQQEDGKHKMIHPTMKELSYIYKNHEYEKRFQVNDQGIPYILDKFLRNMKKPRKTNSEKSILTKAAVSFQMATGLGALHDQVYGFSYDGTASAIKREVSKANGIPSRKIIEKFGDALKKGLANIGQSELSPKPVQSSAKTSSSSSKNKKPKKKQKKKRKREKEKPDDSEKKQETKEPKKKKSKKDNGMNSPEPPAIIPQKFLLNWLVRLVARYDEIKHLPAFAGSDLLKIIRSANKKRSNGNLTEKEQLDKYLVSQTGNNQTILAIYDILKFAQVTMNNYLE